MDFGYAGETNQFCDVRRSHPAAGQHLRTACLTSEPGDRARSDDGGRRATGGQYAVDADCAECVERPLEFWRQVKGTMKREGERARGIEQGGSRLAIDRP